MPKKNKTVLGEAIQGKVNETVFQYVYINLKSQKKTVFQVMPRISTYPKPMGGNMHHCSYECKLFFILSFYYFT